MAGGKDMFPPGIEIAGIAEPAFTQLPDDAAAAVFILEAAAAVLFQGKAGIAAVGGVLFGPVEVLAAQGGKFRMFLPPVGQVVGFVDLDGPAVAAVIGACRADTAESRIEVRVAQCDGRVFHGGRFLSDCIIDVFYHHTITL